jgi:rubrerythrin
MDFAKRRRREIIGRAAFRRVPGARRKSGFSREARDPGFRNPDCSVIERTPVMKVEEFLAHAIQLESEAAMRFGQLADAMTTNGNAKVGKLFRRLSDYSRLHLSDARARAGFRDAPALRPDEFVWPDLESPESAAIWGADPFIGREEALNIALQAELASLDYYQSIHDTTDDPETKILAKEFVEEERDHVSELRKWIAAHKVGESLPSEP